MGGWIKKEKDLLTDPRIHRIAHSLCAIDRSNGVQGRPFARYLAEALGVVDILWITADSHVDENDVLSLGPRHIEQLTGTQGVCDLLPDEWLEVIDADHVKLPGFHTHNGSEALRTAQAAARQQRYRDRQASRKRDRNVTLERNASVIRPKI